MEKLKNILKYTLNYLGDSIEEYNVGAWALFRDVMSADITSHYIFGGGKKPDENLLEYEFPFIERANRLTKNQEATSGLRTPHPNFTYYTNEGPKKNIEGKPVLTHPETDVITSEYNPYFGKDETITTNSSGKRTFGEYNEGNSTELPLDSIDLTGDNYTIDISEYDGQTLLSKTRKRFQDVKDKMFATIISGFHTSEPRLPVSEIRGKAGLQAYTEKYGLSKGKNLLKVDDRDRNPQNWKAKGGSTNGYSDPYCRVWTWHKRYESLGDTMRPFMGDSGSTMTMNELDYGDSNWQMFRAKNGVGYDDGGTRLGEYGVLYDNSGKTNGLVNITPQNDGNGNVVVSVKKCMFSIENLAWKGTYHSGGDEDNVLSNEQKGPLGGRIMWFPPYGLSFNESTNSNWATNEFIGRGEPIFTYANTVRTGTLSFKLLIDHPAILDYWDRRQEKGIISESGPDGVTSKEQQMLRFFAGCSLLMANGSQDKINGGNGTANSGNGGANLTITDENGKEQARENVVNNEQPKIQFFIFYPNNYSGKDDNIQTFNPITYLVNGVGANKRMVGGVAEDFYPTELTKYEKHGTHIQVGGYEMRHGIGVSVIDTQTSGNTIATVDYENGSGGLSYELAKMTGNAKKSAYNPSWSEEEKEEWHKRRYYYRADKDTLDQILVGSEDEGAVSYIDKSSTCLNSTGYAKAFDTFDIPQGTVRCSLADMFVATNSDNYGVLENLYTEETVETIKKILTGGHATITQVVSYGYASNQGNNPDQKENDRRNNNLAKNRALTANRWLQDVLKDGNIDYKVGSFSIDDQKPKNPYDSNDPTAKLQRCAFVEIFYNQEDTENAGDTNVGSEQTLVANNNTTQPAVPKDTQEQAQPIQNGITTRYDNEARFFDRLGMEAPYMARLLSERIKNFDPVFHSMSPEGFNARLTFLNQCMRQGPTISSTDTGGLNSNNLAFGRPPVCVLRVGDFYNTKIIITNMTINYDPLIWDLNQEGIGVMPMIANVSLTFNFIGGSDLGGPIQRLQNATSFNYYANTNVYDNRAETIDYETPDKVDFRAYDPFIKPKNQ